MDGRCRQALQPWGAGGGEKGGGRRRGSIDPSPVPSPQGDSPAAGGPEPLSLMGEKLVCA